MYSRVCVYNSINIYIYGCVCPENVCELWPKPELFSFILTYERLPRFRGRSRTTIDFRSASANPGFQTPGFQAPSLRGASALRVFTSARSSYFKPKIKRIHGGFGRCSCAYTHLYIYIFIYIYLYYIVVK